MGFSSHDWKPGRDPHTDCANVYGDEQATPTDGAARIGARGTWCASLLCDVRAPTGWPFSSVAFAFQSVLSGVYFQPCLALEDNLTRSELTPPPNSASYYLAEDHHQYATRTIQSESSPERSRSLLFLRHISKTWQNTRFTCGDLQPAAHRKGVEGCGRVSRGTFYVFFLPAATRGLRQQ